MRRMVGEERTVGMVFVPCGMHGWAQTSTIVISATDAKSEVSVRVDNRQLSRPHPPVCGDHSRRRNRGEGRRVA